MKTALLLTALLIALPKVAFSDECEETCTVTNSVVSGCTQSTCQGCLIIEGNEGNCDDCCLNQTEGECNTLAGCHWAQFTGWGQCQNKAGVSCDGIPEVPQKSRTWLLGAFLLAGFGLTGFFRLKKKSSFGK
ncbi:MAG: hypothetical protein ACKN9V_07455 [Pseudomonadota bacterium]